MVNEVLEFEDILDKSDEDLIPEELTYENLSDKLIEENILEQIRNLNIDCNNPVDYMNIFNLRLTYLLNEYKKEEMDTEYAIVEAKQLVFYTTIAKALSKRFSINISIDMDYKEECFLFIYSFYRMFILNYSANISNYCLSYINKNKNTLSTLLEKENDNLDKTKKIFKRKMDNIIFNNINKVMEIIKSDNEYNYEEIIKTIIDSDPDLKENYIINKLVFIDSNTTYILENTKDSFRNKILDILSISNINHYKFLAYFQTVLLKYMPLKDNYKNLNIV